MVEEMPYCEVCDGKGYLSDSLGSQFECDLCFGEGFHHLEHSLTDEDPENDENSFKD